MKKILLASTALVLSAGIASAQNVSVGADARMGVNYDGTTWNTQGRTRVNFGLSRQGDNGLSFGGTLRIGQSWTNGGAASAAPTNGSIFIEAQGLRLTMGDIDGAVANRVALYGGSMGFTGGLRGASLHGFDAGFSEGDSGLTSAVRVDYSIDGFGLSASTRPSVGGTGEIAASYSFDGFTVAAGYREGGNYGISATYGQAGMWSVGALGVRSAATGATSYRVWGSFDVTPELQLRASVNRYGTGFIPAPGAGNAYALGAAYSLGGGAHLHGAIARDRGTTLAEIGTTFSF